MKRLFYLLLLFGSFQLASAQNRTISGVVTDATDGSTIPGVTVAIVGTGDGTICDIDGNYSITVSSSAKALKFSFMGMDAQTVDITSSNVINVSLSSSAIAVEELVVIGYGAQKKESVVGSVVQAKGAELLKAGAVTTVSEALAGILPGVSTMQASGQPGASDATILIRGQSTWGNNNPLYVVDGVERDFNDLDPNEIESISVLKDASATAVFGVKGANGVILITTKRGTEGKARINFSGNWGVKVPVMETDYLLDYASAMEYYNVAAINERKYGSLNSESDIAAWRDPNRDMDYYSYTGWIQELLGRGPTQSYNLNISGGNTFIKYFTSLGYNYDGDIFDLEEQDNFDPRTYQKRYNWRSNLDFNFTKSTKLKVNLSGDFKNWHGNYVTNGARSGVAGNGLNDQALGNLFKDVQVGTPAILSDGRMGAGDYGTEWFTNNYLGEMGYEGDVTARSTRVYTDFVFEQKILKDFTAKAKFSYNFYRNYETKIEQRPLYYQTNWETGETTQMGANPDKVEELPSISAEYLNGYNNSMYYELALDYNKTIADNHNVSALALFSRRQYQAGVQFPHYEENWVGRVTYNYKLKYLFEANAAYTGSENWAPGLRFGFFPSIATGWTISEEPFFKDNINFIDFMKFRYSWGTVGNDQLMGDNRFTYMADYGTWTETSTQEGMFGYGSPYSQPDILYYEGVPANVYATWETAVKQNLGLEMNLLDNRLKANIDVFNEYRTGILMTRVAMSDAFGNTAPDANIGETKNHGFEVDLKWNDNINENWSYYVTANLSMSENRIVERDDPPFTPEYLKQAGKPIGWNSGYIMDGYLNSWDDVYNYTQPTAAERIPGDLVYGDYNSDGIINSQDVAPIVEPSYAAKSFAMSLGLRYKQWSMSALFNGAFGLSKGLSGSYLWPYETTGGMFFRMLDTEMLNYWTPDNASAESPALHTVATSYNEWQSTYTVRDADYIRLRSLELKYTFTKESLHRLRIVEKLEIFGNGNNLFTWTNLPDMFDPEAAKLEVYPITKRYSFGLRASF